MWSNPLMDRRKFIKSVAAVGVVVAVPFSLPKNPTFSRYDGVSYYEHSGGYYGTSIASMVHVQEAQRLRNEWLNRLVSGGSVAAFAVKAV